MRTTKFLRQLGPKVLIAVFLLLFALPVRADAFPGEDLNLYFGLLHAHTDISDGSGSVEEAFSHAAAVPGLDFFAVTDHSNSFDNADQGWISQDGGQISQDWAAGKAAAEAVTGRDFVGIFGYEMTWRDSSGLGHMNTFNTPGWCSRNQDGFASLTGYYDALTEAPGSVSQFNHPGPDYGSFEGFSHRTDSYDNAITLLEVGSEKGYTAYRYYTKALDKGWHVAPTNSQNNHDGSWGDESDVRTVILAPSLTEDALYDAMLARRVYATEDRDLQIRYALDGSVLGSVTHTAESHTVDLKLCDPTDSAIGTLEILSDGGKVVHSLEVTEADAILHFSVPGGYDYYYLRVTQPDGDIAVTAPVWTELPALPPPEETTAPTETAPQTPSDPEPTTAPEESTAPARPEDTKPSATEETGPEETMHASSAPVRLKDPQWKLYFGQLHAHTNASDGWGSVGEAFSGAAAVEGMDFFAVTDHSNSFDNADDGSISTDGTGISGEWAAGKYAAQAASDDTFLGLYGYEMTWQEDRGLGHINTFFTPGWQSRSQAGFSSLTAYYDALTQVPGSVSQFNHPGEDYGSFEGFRHRTEEYDRAISLLEIGNEGSRADCRYFIKALDMGWHVAPTLSRNNHNGGWGQDDARTVVLARQLTQDAFAEAMSARRVYATEDRDFCLTYRLDGQIMGSITGTGAQHTVSLNLLDPTDTGSCRVEVVADGGKVVASCNAGNGPTELTVPGGYHYYFLRLTQADRDIAVTAPVWTDNYEDMGIRSFSSSLRVPAAGEPLELVLTLYNSETVPCTLDSIAIYAEDALVSEISAPGTLLPGQEPVFSVPYTASQPGQTRFRAVVQGRLGGATRQWEADLGLRFHPKETVTGILIDGSHSTVKESDYRQLSALAEAANTNVTVFTGPMPSGGEILIVPAPDVPFEEAFLARVSDFAASGGTVILWGGGENEEQQNLLLQSVGASMALKGHASGEPEQAATFNSRSSFCGGLAKNQVFRCGSGFAVAPGNGTWLVRRQDAVFLAWETTAEGALVIAAAGDFLTDRAMPPLASIWATPSANQTILETLLGIRQTLLPGTPVAKVRAGTQGTVYRVQGYATSGTSNPFNTFPDMLYLQDDTGGIGLTALPDEKIQIGTPIEATGRLVLRGGVPELEIIDFRTLTSPLYRFDPETLPNADAMDFAARGGSLVQVEARATSVTLTADGKGVCRFTLRDAWGGEAVVLIEDAITSGKFGTNNLASKVKVGRTVRAVGILHLDENGLSVIRVRNCDEVVHIPPVTRMNPFTGDRIPFVAMTGLICLVAAVMLLCWKKRRR